MFIMLMTLAALASGEVVQTAHSEDVVLERVETWAALAFEDSREAIQKTGSTFVAKGFTEWPCSGFSCMAKGDWRLHFTLRVDTKPGRYRVIVQDAEIAWPASRTDPAHRGEIRREGDRSAAAEELTALVEDLIAYVERDTSEW